MNAPAAVGAAARVAATRAATPLRWLGAASAFGLSLPPAVPTPSTMYGPRGVWLGDGVLAVCDTGNHRVLLWNGGVPGEDHAEADVVLGQPDMASDAPSMLHLPTGVSVIDGCLVVCDAWHHRILVWDGIPDRSGMPPAYALGQADLTGTDEGCGPDRFYWPFGATLFNKTFWVADTGNRRVLGWHGGLPTPGRLPDLLLGQSSFEGRGENRDGAVSARSFRWPHALTGHQRADGSSVLLVADAGNHRILGWRGSIDGDRDADLVLGQPSFETAREWPYGAQGPSAMRFPYGASFSPNGSLAVADTSNNRVLLWNALDVAATTGAPADDVLGQHDLDANGENRWKTVAHDSLCWPYGLHWSGDRIAIADSGNNRVVVWDVQDRTAP